MTHNLALMGISNKDLKRMNDITETTNQNHESDGAANIGVPPVVMRFDLTGGPFGDETCNYNVSVPAETTVGEFIESVLMRDEWGHIKIDNWNSDPICHYRRGKLVQGRFPYKDDLPIDPPDSEVGKAISSITANGGWSLMNYVISTVGA